MKKTIDIEVNKYGGALAIDCWMDNEKKTTYFGVTVHYISMVNGKLVLNDRVLVIRELCAEISKSGEYLRSKLIEYLTEFDILDCLEDKLVFISDRGYSLLRSFHEQYGIQNCLKKTKLNPKKINCGLFA